MSIKAKRALFIDFMDKSFLKKEKTPSYLFKSLTSLPYLFFTNNNKIYTKTIFADLSQEFVKIKCSDRKKNTSFEIVLDLHLFFQEFNVCNPLQFDIIFNNFYSELNSYE